MYLFNLLNVQNVQNSIRVIPSQHNLNFDYIYNEINIRALV